MTEVHLVCNGKQDYGVFPARRDRAARLGRPDTSARGLNPGNEGVAISHTAAGVPVTSDREQQRFARIGTDRVG